MRVTANLNQPQSRAKAQDLMMIGRPGRPQMMQRFVANKMRLRGLGDDPYQGTTPGTSTPPNVFGYQGPLILPLNYSQNTYDLSSATAQNATPFLQSLPTLPAQYYWAISQPYLGAMGVKTYYYIVMGPDGPGFTMPGNPPVLPLSAASGLMNQVNQTIANPGVTQNANNPNATVAIVTGGGSGTQGGGSNVLSAAPVSSPNTLPNSQTSIQTANTTGTSGGATGNLVNGLPAQGSNINPQLLTSTTDYTPYLLGAAALILLVMVSK